MPMRNNKKKINTSKHSVKLNKYSQRSNADAQKHNLSNRTYTQSHIGHYQRPDLLLSYVCTSLAPKKTAVAQFQHVGEISPSSVGESNEVRSKCQFSSTSNISMAKEMRNEVENAIVELD